MNPMALAEEGIKLLKQAVTDYLKDKPNGERTTVIRDDLGLRAADMNGQWRDGLIWGIGNLLQHDGLALLENRGGHNFLVPISN